MSVKISVWRRTKGGWKEGLLAIWEFSGGYCFYTHHYGCTVNCLCAYEEKNHFCLEYLLYFLNSLIIHGLTLPKISPLSPLFLITKLSYILSATVHSTWFVLQEVPYICLVHHTAVINTHALLFP